MFHLCRNKINNCDMTAHKNASGSDGIYCQEFIQLILSRNNKLPDDAEFYSFLSSWELHSLFKPMERSLSMSANEWVWQESPVKGYKNEVWMKRHLELLMEANYERELNGIHYEFSIHGEHRINKIKDRSPNRYFGIMEKMLALYEQKLFGNNDIQNKVYSRYEKQINI